MEAAIRAGAPAESGAPVTVRVWDPFVRLFHWSLVAGFAVAFVSGDEWQKLHNGVGYVVLALVGARILWGFVAPGYARFSRFVVSPGATLRYLGDIAMHRERRYLGHNPAGAAMILALLAGMVALGVTGWMMTLDAYFGAEWLEEAHEALAYLLLALVALHVAGVLLAGRRHRENLVRAMIGGRKSAPTGDDIA